MVVIRSSDKKNLPDINFVTILVPHLPVSAERLEELVWIGDDGLPGRLDMCECERLLRCPNGTISASGSQDVYNCEVCCYDSTTIAIDTGYTGDVVCSHTGFSIAPNVGSGYRSI